MSGNLLVNSDVREEESFRRQSCYIMQDDNLQPLLTVLESITVAANLKLTTDVSVKEKQARVRMFSLGWQK